MLQPRLRAFVLSLGLHVGGVAVLVEASHRGWLEALPPTTRHRESRAWERRRIVWYTKTADLPPVAPLDPPARSRPAAAKLTAPETIRAYAPRPESRRQVILQPLPAIRLPSDLALPNVLAWNPEPPAAPRRRFQLTAPAVPRPQRQALDAAAPELAFRPAAAPLLPAAPLPARPRFQVPERVAAPRPVSKPLDTSAPQLALRPATTPTCLSLPARPDRW